MACCAASVSSYGSSSLRGYLCKENQLGGNLSRRDSVRRPKRSSLVTPSLVPLCASSHGTDQPSPMAHEWTTESTVLGRSMADFTRFQDNGKKSVELQTAIVRYRQEEPWWNYFFSGYTEVDLVAVVHIADKSYFKSLQSQLESYDRVLYEMVADKSGMVPEKGKRVWGAGRPKWRPVNRTNSNRRKRRGGTISLVSWVQRTMARLLSLDFQLECMDYSRDHWFNADLDLQTFKRLQRERGETFLSFAQTMTATTQRALTRSVTSASPYGLSGEKGADLAPWQERLQWLARFVPMPLLGLFIIDGVCAPPDSPLKRAAEVEALLDLDLAAAMKVVLARQLTDRSVMDHASDAVISSVIIGERNAAVMDELRQALADGCTSVAILYGAGHLPDLDRRLRQELGLRPVAREWRAAWAIPVGWRGRQAGADVAAGGASDGAVDALAGFGRASGWPLNRYQTLGVLLCSLVMAADLYFWELLLNGLEDYSHDIIVYVVNLLEAGWTL